MLRKGMIVFMEKKGEALKNVTAGAAAGLVNGLFGGGGGIILLPVLKYFLKLDVKSAHATGIAVMLPISAVSAAVSIARDSSILGDGIIYGVSGVLGALISAKLFKNANKTVPTAIFAVTSIIMAVMILFE